MALEKKEHSNNKSTSADTATAAAAAAASSNDTKTKERKRKRRWGDAVAKPTTTTTTTAATASTTTATSTTADPNRVSALQESIKARLAAAKAKQQQQQQTAGGLTATASAATSSSTIEPEQPRPVKRAKHYELDLSVTGPTFQAAAAAAKPAKKVNPYLAHLSSQDNEQESAVSSTAAAAAAEKQQQEDDNDTMIRASKPRPRHKEIHFVEPGHWQEVAEKKREKAAQAAAAGYVSGRKAGHTIHAAGIGATSSSSDMIYGRSASDMLLLQDDDNDYDYAVVALPPRADAHVDTKMPLCMEWWDMELLPSKVKKQVAATESQALSKQSKAALQQLLDSSGGSSSSTKKSTLSTADTDAAATKGNENENKKEDYDNDDSDTIKDLRECCFDQASLRYSKTAALVQHIVPIRPANSNTDDAGPRKQPVLHLTKKERKRQLKLRRQEKQRELQDLQAAGLIPAPEPRLTLRNFIQVLGDQAFVDPSQMEQKVMEQVQARQRAHLERNEANKLTKEQRAAKRERKIQEDTTTGVTVAVFYVKDMSHPYHRAKVDLNAQQYKISGGVLECQNPPLACVICEGGPKAIKKYSRLMLVRMKWTGPDDVQDLEDEDVEGEEDGEYKTQKFNPDNKCDLVWQGMAVKPLFKGFFFQSCETSDQARKVLKNKGVAHYWDQLLRHASGRDSGLQVKLTANDDDGDESDNPYENQKDEDEDIIMKE